MRKLIALILFSFSAVAQVAHPRIWLDSMTMTHIRAQIASTHYSGTATSDSDAFTALMVSADSYKAQAVAPYDRSAMPANAIYYNYEGAGWLAAVQPLALAYRITGDTEYASKVKEILNAMVNTGLVLSLTSVSGITSGMTVSGTNIPAGTTVVSVNASGNAFNPWPQLTLSTWMADTIPAGTTITVGGTAYTTPTASTSYCNLGLQDPQRVDSGYPSRNSVLALALAYDWIYDQLSSADKTKLAQVLDVWWGQLQSNGYEWNNAAGNHGLTDTGCNNYAAGHLLGFSAAGLAFEGDDPTATAILTDATYGVATRFNGRFTADFAPGGCFSSGYPEESYSNGYGAFTYRALMETVQAYSTAGRSSLINNFDIRPWLQRTITASLHNQRPDMWSVTDEGDWSGSYAQVTDLNLLYTLSGNLGSGYPESGYAAYQIANYNFAGVPGGLPSGYSVTPFLQMVFYNPNLSAEDYTAALPTYWYGDALQDFRTITRTDWTSAAAYATFSGNRYQGNHQNANGGHLYIARGSDRLLINAASWKGISGVSGSGPATTQNWATNTLFVSDPTLSGAYTFCQDLHSGCQWTASQQQARGGPTAHRETADYVYSKVQLDSVYGQRGLLPLTLYYRSFVNIAGVSFVYDYSTATNYNVALRKQFWHTPALATSNPAGIASAISVNGNTASATVGTSTLWIKALLPATVSITESNDYLTEGYTGSQSSTQRFEISDPAQARTPVTTYLTVLAPTASSVQSMPATSLISASNYRGALYNDGTLPRIVMFSADSQQWANVSYTVAYDSRLVGRHVVLDLKAGIYDVRRNGVILYKGLLTGHDGSLSFPGNGGATYSVSLTALPSAACQGQGAVHGRAAVR